MISARPLDVLYSELHPSYALLCQRDGRKIMLYSVDTQNSDGRIIMPTALSGHPTRLIDVAFKDR
jgi:hypothetical protein